MTRKMGGGYGYGVVAVVVVLVRLSLVTSTWEQLSSRECENIGFTGLALCSDCNTLSEYVKDKGSLNFSFEGVNMHLLILIPAITIILHMGAGGRGAPPLGTPDGRVRYKFASFRNRNHAFRNLQCAANNLHEMLEAEKKENAESELRAHSSSVIGSKIMDKVLVESMPKTGKLQPFITEEALVGIYSDEFPCTAEQFFNLLLNDGSQFTSKYRSIRKDTNLVMGQWHTAEEYDGQVREITFRSLCTSPMCPPDTSMTEWQRFVLSPDKKKLVFETVQQAHDVPFGSHFEVHCIWSLETTTESSSTLDIKVGAHFKKWCVMQSKIKSRTVNQYKKEVELMLDVARSYIKLHGSDDETDEASISGDLRSGFYLSV